MREAARRLMTAIRLILGLPDYDAYCAHQRLHHPDVPLMDRGAFVLASQNRRYGGGGPTRCC